MAATPHRRNRLAARLVCGTALVTALGVLLLALSLAAPIPASVHDMRVDRGFVRCPVGRTGGSSHRF